jgi:hypothetical protein
VTISHFIEKLLMSAMPIPSPDGNVDIVNCSNGKQTSDWKYGKFWMKPGIFAPFSSKQDQQETLLRIMYFGDLDLGDYHSPVQSFHMDFNDVELILADEHFNALHSASSLLDIPSTSLASAGITSCKLFKPHVPVF